MPDKHLIVLSGPTASGKTSLAIHLAQHYGTAIVSADSRQFFREMSVGTAKPTAKELAQAPHHFIGSHSVEEAYSVGQYEAEALQLLGQLFDKHDVVILTGGSGLYISALCQGIDAFPEVPAAVREALEREYEQHGIGHLQKELQAADPAYYAEVDLNNPHRLIRALSVCRVSGQPYSSFRRAGQAKRPFTPIYLQLHWPREQLYERINHRVELMMEQGLEKEARALYPRRELTALQTVGYQELFDYFEGRHSREEAIELIKRNSRRYAKRQLTWFRRDGHWKLFRPTEWEELLRYIAQCRQHQLSWQQKRQAKELWQKIELRSKQEVLGDYRLYQHKTRSLALSTTPPPSDFQWIAAHQLSLLGEGSEEAFWLRPPGATPGFGWAMPEGASLPDWAKRVSTGLPHGWQAWHLS